MKIEAQRHTGWCWASILFPGKIHDKLVTGKLKIDCMGAFFVKATKGSVFVKITDSMPVVVRKWNYCCQGLSGWWWFSHGDM